MAATAVVPGHDDPQSEERYGERVMPQPRPSEIELPDPEMVIILREKTGAERLAIAFGLWRMARQIVECSERERHQELPEQEIQERIARRMSHGAI